MDKLVQNGGSKWNIWDLHIHSPASVLHSGYKGDWESYFSALENLEEISVVGITDYFSVEGYKAVKARKDQGFLDNIELILPNVELRINKMTKDEKPINLHIIFNPKIVDDLDRHFFKKLKFTYVGREYNCDREDLIRLGGVNKFV